MPPAEFRLESELVAVVRAAAPRLLPKGRVKDHVLSHPQVGPIVPDLMLVRFPLKANGRIFSRTQPRVSGFEAAVLAELLAHGHTATAELAFRLYSTVERTEDAVNRLSRRGLVHRAEISGAVRAVPKRFAGVEVVAVEAKLARWRQAVSQAQAYLGFSNSAYVALPRSKAHNEALLTECRSRGLGVISVGQGVAEVLLRATSRRVLSPDWVNVVCRC